MSGACLPEEGKKAPAFTLPASNGKDVKLSDFKGKHVVLYFYPRDNTPGCTLEAKGFRGLAEAFTAKNAVILGVSTDSVASHCRFIEKQGLNFLLLADEAHKLAEKYGVWVEKNRYGKKSMGIQRATVLIGPDGAIRATWPKVKPEGHAEEVLAALG